jgi:hypothetical protein
LEGPEKLYEAEIKWGTSIAGLPGVVNLSGDNINTVKENTGVLKQVKRLV